MNAAEKSVLGFLQENTHLDLARRLSIRKRSAVAPFLRHLPLLLRLRKPADLR